VWLTIARFCEHGSVPSEFLEMKQFHDQLSTSLKYSAENVALKPL
jgi:hypothetical protein